MELFKTEVLKKEYKEFTEKFYRQYWNAIFAMLKVVFTILSLMFRVCIVEKDNVKIVENLIFQKIYF